MPKQKKPRRITIRTFSQCVCLTVELFIKNRLLSYAGACSFSFLFSFIPVFLMTIVVLVRILHASPDVVESVFALIPQLGNYFSIDSVIKAVQSLKTVNLFEILIGISIFWLARRFFASVFDSLQNIFHTHAQRKAIATQGFTFVVEALIIIVTAAVMFACMLIQTVTEIPIISSFLRKIPALSFFFNGILITNFIRYFPNILIFTVLLILYRTVPGSRPKKSLCALSSFLCTAAFFVFRSIMHLFLNVANYNLIYGFLGQVIIMLMDIYFFFTFFLAFAQFMFVCQFFGDILTGTLYMLPKQDEAGFFGSARARLFIRPDYFLACPRRVRDFFAGDEIFSKGDEAECAYFIAEGIVSVERDGKSAVLKPGEFFGETECLAHLPRKSSARAEIQSKLIVIGADEMNRLIMKNHAAARKILTKALALANLPAFRD